MEPKQFQITRTQLDNAGTRGPFLNVVNRMKPEIEDFAPHVGVGEKIIITMEIVEDDGADVSPVYDDGAEYQGDGDDEDEGDAQSDEDEDGDDDEAGDEIAGDDPLANVIASGDVAPVTHAPQGEQPREKRKYTKRKKGKRGRR